MRLNNKDKSGICMVLGAYYPDIAGGAVQCYNLIDSLRDSFDFYVIATYKVSSGTRRAKRIFTEENINSARVFRINLYPGKLISEILSLLALLIIFFRVKNKVQVFHMHGFTRKGYLITLLAKAFRKKTIVKTTSFGIDDPLSIRKRSLVSSALYSLVSAHVVTSPVQKDSFKMAGYSSDKIYMIPNGVNLRRFNVSDALEKTEIRKSMDMTDSSDVILSVGFFSKEKGLDVFAESLLLLPVDKLRDIFLIFVGSRDDGELEVDGEVVKKVNDIIERLNMRSNCLFVDSVHDIDKYFKASDIFILPSRREGLPNALLEAMACGLYCIANKLDGITDYIIDSGENGYLLDVLSPASIADGLKRAIGDKDIQRKFSYKAHSKINRVFNMDQIKERYRELYASLIKE